MKLDELPNIGPKLASLLSKHGIGSAEDLKALGAVAACRRLETSSESCVNKLYALEGAIREIRWHDIPKDEREALRRQFLEG